MRSKSRLSGATDIVHVIAPDASGGGAEAVIEALALARRGQTRVIILNQIAAHGAPAHPFAAHLQSRGITTSEIRCGRRSYLNEARALQTELRARPPRVVHSHGYHGDVVAYLATRKLGVPLVSTVHGYIRRNLKEHLYNVLDRFLLRRFDAIIAVSPTIVSELARHGLNGNRVHLVRNGLKTPSRQHTRAAAREQLGLPLQGQVIGWIGRLSPEKGPDLFLHALLSANLQAHAVLIGEGPEIARINQMIRDMPKEMSARISLAGYRRDAGGLLNAFDLLALSSRTEGTPMVVLEAVASGVPIVAFEVGGIPDLLSNETAWLVRAGDPEAFGTTLAQAIAHPLQSSEKARKAASILEDVLSPERWMDRVESVYDCAASLA